MRSPDEVAREWVNSNFPIRAMPGLAVDGTVDRLADLIRQRDAEHEALRREESQRVWQEAWESFEEEQHGD